MLTPANTVYCHLQLLAARRSKKALYSFTNDLRRVLFIPIYYITAASQYTR